MILRSLATGLAKALPALFLVCFAGPPVRADDFIPNQHPSMAPIRDVIVKSVGSGDSVSYWFLDDRSHWDISLPSGIEPMEETLSCASCYHIGFSPPAQLNVIKERWRRTGVSVRVERRNGEVLDLNNCFLMWEVPTGYRDASPLRKIDLRLFLAGPDRIGMRLAELNRVEFTDDGSASIEPRAKVPFVEGVRAEVTGVQLIPTIHGMTYEPDGEYNNPNRPHFRSHSVPFDEIRRMVVTGRPQTPEITGLKWTQASPGGHPRIYERTVPHRIEMDGLAPDVSFSGEIRGSDFVEGARVLFCAGQSRERPFAETSCQQPKGAVEVRSSSLLTFTDAVLPQGFWQVFVKTEIGISSSIDSEGFEKSTVVFGVFR